MIGSLAPTIDLPRNIIGIINRRRLSRAGHHGRIIHVAPSPRVTRVHVVLHGTSFNLRYRDSPPTTRRVMRKSLTMKLTCR
jgi:hypothetical protein